MTASPPARRSLLALVALIGALAIWLAGAPAEPPARAASQNRAVVVIDDGVRRTSTCIRFGSSSLSGVDALRLAVHPDPVTASFGSGEAVCGIGGVGCPASGCLTCQAPAYWHYYRAPGGGSFRYSGTGGSTTSVGDGDVEAWVWGSTVTAGPVPSIDGVCGLEPPDETPTTPTPTAPPLPRQSPGAATAVPGAAPLPAEPAPGSVAPTESLPSAGDPQGDAPPDASPTTVGASSGGPSREAGGTGEEVAGAAMAGEPVATSADAGRTSSSLPALVLFALLVIASVVGVVWFRRRAAGEP